MFLIRPYRQMAGAAEHCDFDGWSSYGISLNATKNRHISCPSQLNQTIKSSNDLIPQWLPIETNWQRELTFLVSELCSFSLLLFLSEEGARTWKKMVSSGRLICYSSIWVNANTHYYFLICRDLLKTIKTVPPVNHACVYELDT